jgi:signal transduction histidine kinase
MALAAMWLALLSHLQLGVPFLVADAVVLWTAFATARWGSIPTVWLSGLSVPAAIIPIGVWSIQWAVLPDWAVQLPLPELYQQFGQLAGVVAGLLVGAALAVPWLLGLLLRSLESARRSRELQAGAERSAVLADERAERERELAELRDDQARLAHDVHDVVGHSLAVVLAQAESAQLLSDPEQVRASLANIATSARSSLRDVRQVLGRTGEGQPGDASPGSIDTLVENVRQSGHDVRTHVEGTSRPLPPELGTVAFRVTQEMLTNALRHGDRGQPVDVQTRWSSDELTIAVRNRVAADDPTVELDPEHPGGTGLVGMQRRLGSVGGRLDTLRGSGSGGATYTATAILPLRGRPA